MLDFEPQPHTTSGIALSVFIHVTQDQELR